MALRRIRLELARDPRHPAGSSRHGYESVAPLAADGRLDPQAWRAEAARRRVRRFWAGADDEHGRLRHHGGRRRVFHYDDAPVPDPDGAEEPIFELDRHRFVEGEYVPVTEHDGVQRTCRVVEVRAED